MTIIPTQRALMKVRAAKQVNLCFINLKARVKQEYSKELADFRQFLPREFYDTAEGEKILTAAWYGRTPDLVLLIHLGAFYTELSGQPPKLFKLE